MRKLITVLVIGVLLLNVGCVRHPTSTSTPGSDASPSLTTVTATLKVVGQVGGSIQAVAVSGDYAYIGVGMRVMIVDISNPTGLREIGATQLLEGEVRDIAVDGNFAYVAAAGGGLFSINIAEPTRPVVTGNVDTPGYAEAVAVAGKYAYVADGPDGLLVIDVFNPEKLKIIGSAYESSYSFDVALQDNRAYIAAAGAGLLVADVSDPTKPRETSSLDTPGYAYGVAISGSTAYVADGWEGMQLVDISDASRLSCLSKYATKGWAMKDCISGTKLYVADAFAGLGIFDVSDRARPVLINTLTIQGGHAASLTIDDNTVYVADIYHGLNIVDVTNPAQPQLLNQYSPMSYAHAVDVIGDYAYVASETDGLRIVDVSDVGFPQEVAEVALENPAVGIVAVADTAYVFSFFGSTSSDFPRLFPIDVSDPQKPIESTPQDIAPGGQKINMVCRGLFVQGSAIFQAGEWGLLIYDVSDPLAPRLISFFQTSETSGIIRSLNTEATGVAVDSNKAYVAADDMLLIVDVADLSNPTLLGTFGEPVEISKIVDMIDVAVASSYAYVLDGSCLRTIDVSDSVHPQEVSYYSLPCAPFCGATHSLEIKENRLFVAAAAAGVFIFSLDNPTKPQLIDHLQLPGQVSWIRVSGDYLYAAAGEGGLYIVEYSGSPSSENVTSPRISKTLPVHLSQIETADSASPEMPPISNRKTYTVSTTADSGPGSLRECLHKADSGDTVVFDEAIFPSEKPTTIYLKEGLVIDRDGITIDGSNAGVILDGSGVEKSSGFGISIIDANYNTIKGLQIMNFAICGINLSGKGNVIGGDRTRGKGPLGEGNLISGSGGPDIATKLAYDSLIIGNFVGTDISGRSKVSKSGADSINIAGASPHNRIENNVIAERIWFVDRGSSYNIVVGNHIGVDVTGTVAFEGQGRALGIGLSFNRIGGTAIGEGNVINGTIHIMARTRDTLVLGNIIGVQKASTGFSSESYLTLGQGSYHNFIGGATKEERNLINNGRIDLQYAYDNTIANNYLGTDITGKTVVSVHTGIKLAYSERNAIQNNLILGNEGNGVTLEEGANDNLVRFNNIGQATKYGVEVAGKNNRITGNVLVNNAQDARDTGTNNFWDDGHKGNYWSHYRGKDADGDGMGDTLYQIPFNGVDKYLC
jgi:hypothetical protein